MADKLPSSIKTEKQSRPLGTCSAAPSGGYRRPSVSKAAPRQAGPPAPMEVLGISGLRTYKLQANSNHLPPPPRWSQRSRPAN